MNISVQAFPTILISLTVLGLAGCIPAYYTREDGRKMSTAERQSLCERLSSRSKFRCETQPANMQGMCYEVNKNAEESLANLECGAFDPAVTSYQAMKTQERTAKFELSRAINIPPEAQSRIPDKWAWESMDSATPDLTGTEWVASSFHCTLGCPKTLRFLPQGRLVVSRDWVIDDKSRAKLPEYGRAEEGQWSQKQRRVYLQFNVEKPGEKDPRVVTLRGFGTVERFNREGREVVLAELSLSEASHQSGASYLDLRYEIRRR
jgi:hypothetical protein